MCSRRATIQLLVLGFLTLGATLFTARPARAQVCGDADGSGDYDISDLAAMVDYMVFATPLGNYDNCELDGYSDVTISDLLFFERPIDCPSHPGPGNGCQLPLGPPLDPPTRNGDCLVISDSMYPSDHLGTLPVTVAFKTADPLLGATFSFQFLLNGVPARIAPGEGHTETTAGAHIISRTDSTHIRLSILASDGCTPLTPGFYKLASVSLENYSFPFPNLPITILQAPFPVPVNPHTNLPVHRSIMIFSSFTDSMSARSPISVLVATPTVQYGFPSCCQGMTGNVDCDPGNAIDISDLSAIIDNLYISFTPLCCRASANCDDSPDGNVDIADLSALIDYLYVSFSLTASCQ